ncbi:MAG: undecaprenyl-diphosphate phosphatase [Nitriliruptoraceae bacterium]
MTLVVALILGIIQGVFEFVPVSSTSHFVLAQIWLEGRGSLTFAPDSPDLMLFDLVIHLGTVVSVVFVMRQPLRELLSELTQELRTGVRLDAPATRYMALLLLTVLTTGVLGLMFRDVLLTGFRSMLLMATALIITGFAIWWTDSMRTGQTLGSLRFGWRGAQQITVGIALAIGVAQALALYPGISRSGITIFVALLVGMQRETAARYSFLVAIPTIIAATAFEALAMLGEPGAYSIGIAPLAIGFLSAAAVGTVALIAVLKLLEAARFRVFSVYVWALALTVIVIGPTVF